MANMMPPQMEQMPPDPTQQPDPMQGQPEMDPAQLAQLMGQAQPEQAPPDPIQAVAQLLLQIASKVPQTELSVEVQTKAVLALAQSIKLLTDAQAPPQAGVDPQLLGQLEVQKVQADYQLKQVELQHKMKLRDQEFQLRAQQATQKAQLDQEAAQVKQSQASHDAALKEQDAQMKQAVTSQTAQIQAAQAEQKMQQGDEAHKKALAAPQPKPAKK